MTKRESPKPDIDPDVLAEMRKRGGTWAVYRNICMDSRDLGRLQFLKFGPGCTHETPPERAPDTPSCGPGWKYRLEGTVNLSTGETEPMD